MPHEPEVQPLSYQARSRFFLAVMAIFVLAVPFLIFYAIGYRFDFSEDLTNITSVGGMFVSSDLDEVTMYIDDSLVTDMRFFQTAAYIQNLREGMHKIVVSADDAQVWVKELPVFPHIVTEVHSFNMPATSTIRIIPRRLNDGVATVSADAKAQFAARDVTVQNATTSATTSAVITTNPEWEYLTELFAATTTPQAAESGFLFASAIPESEATTTATTTVRFDAMQLFERADDVYAEWVGEESKIPYYFCVRQGTASTTAELYGQHVAEAVFSAEAELAPGVIMTGDRYCRTEIRIDDLRQEVLAFNFLPDSRDHVLMQLSDGLYVVEIDDRAWQNAQRIYAGTDFRMMVDGRQVFILEDGVFFELATAVVVSTN
jgi:hypothetical protein